MDDDLYEYDRSLGKGSFGSVFLIKRKTDGKRFAVKRIDFDERTAREEAVKEAQVLSHLQHTHILTYLESFEDDICINIVTEYCERGDLAGYLQCRQGNALKENHILLWMYQMTSALQYMHSQKILHRDMKTKNIFLNSDWNLKLGDMGIAKVLDICQSKAETFVGTLAYIAPELLEHKPYDHKADIWGFGCCAFEMVALKRAFPGAAMFVIVKDITTGKLPEFPEGYSKELEIIIVSMLQQKPSDHPSCDDLLQNKLQEAGTWSIHDVLSPACTTGNERQKRDSANHRSLSSKGCTPTPIPSHSWKGITKQIYEREKQNVISTVKEINKRMEKKSHGEDDEDEVSDTFIVHNEDETSDTFILHDEDERSDTFILHNDDETSPFIVPEKDETSDPFLVPEEDETSDTFIVHDTKKHGAEQTEGTKGRLKRPSKVSSQKKLSSKSAMSLSLPVGTKLENLIQPDDKTQHILTFKPDSNTKMKDKETTQVLKVKKEVRSNNSQHVLQAQAPKIERDNAASGATKKKVKKKPLIAKVVARKKSDSEAIGNTPEDGSDDLTTVQKVPKTLSKEEGKDSKELDSERDSSNQSHRLLREREEYVPFDKRRTTDSIKGIMAFMSTPENRELCVEQAELLQKEIAEDIGAENLAKCYDLMGSVQDDSILKAVLQDLIGRRKFEEYQTHLFFLRMYEISCMASS